MSVTTTLGACNENPALANPQAQEAAFNNLQIFLPNIRNYLRYHEAFIAQLRGIPLITSPSTPDRTWRGSMFSTSSGFTFTQGVFSAGDIGGILNTSGGNLTLTQAASTTLSLNGTLTTGNRTLLPGITVYYWQTAAICWLDGAVS